MVKILPCGRLPDLKSYLGLLPGEKEDLDGTLSVPQYQGQISWTVNVVPVFAFSHSTRVAAVLKVFVLISRKYQF